jgi:hypothetical protein
VSRDFILIQLHTSLFHFASRIAQLSARHATPSPMEVELSLPARTKNSCDLNAPGQNLASSLRPFGRVNLSFTDFVNTGLVTVAVP